MDLIIIVVASLAQAPLVVFTDGLSRLLAGMVLVLFVPGYAFLAAALPRQASLDVYRRLLLSVGLSVALVPLIGIALHESRLLITTTSSVVALSAFNISMAGIAYMRRGAYPPGIRYSPIGMPTVSLALARWNDHSRSVRTAIVVIVIAIMAPILTSMYVLGNPKTGAELTQFYLLGWAGSAAEYPVEFTLEDGAVSRVRFDGPDGIPRFDSSGRTTVAVVNRERRRSDYRIRVVINGEAVEGAFGPRLLEPGETWEQDLTISPTQLGNPQKVEILLFRDTDVEPYRALALWIDVVSGIDVESGIDVVSGS